MSRRCTLWPTSLCCLLVLGLAFAVASRRNDASDDSSQYVVRLPPGPSTVPSFTSSTPASTPRRAAAAPSSSARASAQANCNAVPLSWIDRLPDVTPSFGVRDVSPETTRSRPRSTSSSSATICVSAVRMPWPSSTLPVNMVTVPSASIRNQLSSCRLPFRLPGSTAAAGACATAGTKGDKLNRTVSEPPLRKARRWRPLLMRAPSPRAGSPARCAYGCRSGTGCRPSLRGSGSRPGCGRGPARPSPT